MEIVGYCTFLGGLTVCLLGEAMICARAYRRGVLLFMACLVIPFVAWAFCLQRIRELWFPLVLAVGGCLMAFGGAMLCGSDEIMKAFF